MYIERERERERVLFNPFVRWNLYENLYLYGGLAQV